MKIEEIDKNFQAAKVGNLDVRYYDALKAPFALEGFPWRDPALIFNRLPAAFTEKDVNAGALELAKHTAGGAVRFRTDSPYLTLRAVLAYSGDMNHMPRAGSAGFDFYSGAGKNIQYRKTVQPDSGQKDLETLLVSDQPEQMTDWTLYLPLYGAASQIEIGIAPGARLEKPTPHAVPKPVLFYGSSITQGGCASRPGNAYTTMLCRAVDAPQINLGFSGSGRGESAVAQAIAGLDLAAFVMDYDHNAPSLEHLTNTHAKFFKIIRGKNPGLPVIIMSKCDFWGNGEEPDRRDVIRQTYAHAVRAGDTKVWFIDGATLFGTEDRDACTVDRCHPNDLGFYRMFRTILPTLEKALKAQK
ncbi:MAG: hypothetical protein NT011_06270 [Kiritimatiellaeota bacterium]|nr:hypothetical protein [Kiritimatiellota bacterium]